MVRSPRELSTVLSQELKTLEVKRRVSRKVLLRVASIELFQDELQLTSCNLLGEIVINWNSHFQLTRELE